MVKKKRKVSQATLNALARGRAKRRKNLLNRSEKGGVKMVKRRVKRRVSKPRTARRKKSYSNAEKIDMLMDIGFSAVYGYSREKVSSALEPVTNKVPMGLISDEVVLGLGAYLGNKYSKNKKVKKALKNVLIIESSRVGETTADFGFKKTFTGK